MDRPKNSHLVNAQRLGLWSIAGTVLAFALWAALAPLHGAVVSVGLVKTISNRKAVQHTDGGIVRHILVRNGDSVREGQVLVELEDVKNDANHRMLQEMMVFETVRQARLDAEQQLLPSFERREDWSKQYPAEQVDKAYQREQRIFHARRSLLDEQIASYQKQLAAVDHERNAWEQQLESSRNGARLAKEELKLNQALVEQKFVSRARVIALERSVSDYGALQGEHGAQLAQSEQRKSELALRIAAARKEYQRVAAEDYKESSAQLVKLREELRPVDDALRRTAVVAPASGKVVGLKLNAPGEVAPPREPLMEIVPDSEDLVVEARVGVDTIKDLHLDQPTELRFTTFPSRTTPMVQARLSYVSADAVTDQQGTPWYVIQARAEAQSLQDAGIPALRPGMAAEVYVLLESRSVIDYLLTPITHTLRRALREP